MDAASKTAQLGQGVTEPVTGLADQRPEFLVADQVDAGERGRHREELLLGPVVQVALDLTAFRPPRRGDPGPRLLQLLDLAAHRVGEPLVLEHHSDGGHGDREETVTFDHPGVEGHPREQAPVIRPDVGDTAAWPGDLVRMGVCRRGPEGKGGVEQDGAKGPLQVLRRPRAGGREHPVCDVAGGRPPAD